MQTEALIQKAIAEGDWTKKPKQKESGRSQV